MSRLVQLGRASGRRPGSRPVEAGQVVGGERDVERRRRSPRGRCGAWCRGWAPRRRPGRRATPAPPGPASRRWPRRPRGRRRRARGCGRSCRPGTGGGCGGSRRRRAGRGGVTAPVSIPRPSGLYGTRPMPSSRQAGTISSSMSRLKSDHSLCRAAIGWTAAARRTVSADASRQAEVADLAGLDQLGHGADGLLDRARSGRGGGGSRGRCGRCRAGRARRRTPGARTRGRRRTPRPLGVVRVEVMPNLVAMTTSSRSAAMRPCRRASRCGRGRTRRPCRRT